ncbi:hypothetical protein GGU11DRAFT_65695 [Lentinula aff. detonsa]|nr:hypothetical protein GGU11DRAFT_65695 [Lentinula aff. detonsa]
MNQDSSCKELRLPMYLAISHAYDKIPRGGLYKDTKVLLLWPLFYMRPLHTQARETFHLSVYALINLRTRAQRRDDPLAPLAYMICNILKTYQGSCNLVQTLIQVICEYGVEKIERNAKVDAAEIDALKDIELSLIPNQWNKADSVDFSLQVEIYITYFLQKRNVSL